MSPFQLSLPGFEGPIEDLAPRVSARQLALDDLTLAAIPAQFLAETRRRDQVDLEAAGEVLSAVARLMLLKSVHLLAEPEPDDEDEIAADAGVQGMAGLQEAAALLAVHQGRAAFSTPGDADLVPRLVEPRSPRALADAWRHMRSREGRSALRAAVSPFVRLETAMSILLGHLRSGGAVAFGALLRGANRRDVVMHFLAVLELVRTDKVTVRQNGTFEEISVEWAHSDAQRSRAG